MGRFTLQKQDYYTASPVSDIPIVEGGLSGGRKLDIYYVDINTAFKRNLKGLILYDEDVVKGEIANILSTPLGSDHFEPTYGSNVPYRLMDPINNVTSWLLENDTISALNKWLQEPGVISMQLSNSYVIPINNNPDSEGYEIKFTYRVNKTKVISQFHSFLLR